VNIDTEECTPANFIQRGTTDADSALLNSLTEALPIFYAYSLTHEYFLSLGCHNRVAHTVIHRLWGEARLHLESRRITKPHNKSNQV